MAATSINTHLGKNIEWTVYRNGHNELECLLTLDGAVYNSSALAFTVYLRLPGKDNDKLTLTEASGLTHVGASGSLTIPLTVANLVTLPSDRYFILIEYTLASKTYPLAQGYITIKSETNPGTTTDSVTIPVNISGVTVSMAVNLAGSSIETAATFADISASTQQRIIQVNADETNGNEKTFYLHDGENLHWLVTQEI